MSVQFIDTAAGRLAVLPEADYCKLVESAEDAEDVAAIARFNERLAHGEEELIPSEIVKRLLSGEHPVRVWREHRGMKVRDLAEKAGIAPAYVSQIEGGARDGSFETMQKIASALSVSLDDLVQEKVE